MNLELPATGEKAVETEPPTGEKPAYYDGWADGAADRDPDPARLAYGSNRLNAYERGYIDSGTAAREG